jgi:hypothetical protein
MISSEERATIARQIGRIYILMISGGRINAIEDGIELPVSNGYIVRVRYNKGGDDYTVERVFRRAGREWVKGEQSRVYCDQVAEAAYYASCFRSYDETEWVGRAA